MPEHFAAVPKWAKFCVALCLLPLCLGVSQALFWVVGAAEEAGGGRRDVVWVPLLAGAACWWIVYLLLPKPMWVYVFGHELTHALWVWLFEGQVKGFKVSSGGGHVVATKVNFMIALAPYFFPLYAILVVVVYGVGTLIWDWSGQRVWFLLLLGAAYAFHVTLTWHALKTEQTDITSQGYVFSTVVIWLGNAAILLVGLPPLLGVPLSGVGRQVGLGTWGVVAGVLRWFGVELPG